MTRSFRAQLQTALEEMDRACSSSALQQMVLHWELIQEWNERINLTSVKSEQDAAYLHYADSLMPLRELQQRQSLADMGSGAGFPGIPLAIARPDCQVVLVEPRRKRVSFLRVATARLGLQNVRVVQGRSSDEPPEEPFDMIVTRATFSQGDALAMCRTWLKPGGKLVALRAAGPAILAGATLHPYRLLTQERMLEVWTPDPSIAKKSNTPTS